MGHVSEQLPEVHTCPEAQTFPHPPQLSKSVEVSTQESEQRDVEPVQLGAGVPESVDVELDELPQPGAAMREPPRNRRGREKPRIRARFLIVA